MTFLIFHLTSLNMELTQRECLRENLNLAKVIFLNTYNVAFVLTLWFKGENVLAVNKTFVHPAYQNGKLLNLQNIIALLASVRLTALKVLIN